MPLLSQPLTLAQTQAATRAEAADAAAAMVLKPGMRPLPTSRVYYSTRIPLSRWCDLALILAPNAALCRQVAAAANILKGHPLTFQKHVFLNRVRNSPFRWCDLALVLAPNAALCRQVAAAANSLRGADGAPLLTAVQLSAALPPPHGRVDIAVATPGGHWAGTFTIGIDMNVFTTADGGACLRTTATPPLSQSPADEHVQFISTGLAAWLVACLAAGWQHDLLHSA